MEKPFYIVQHAAFRAVAPKSEIAWVNLARDRTATIGWAVEASTLSEAVKRSNVIDTPAQAMPGFRGGYSASVGDILVHIEGGEWVADMVESIGFQRLAFRPMCIRMVLRACGLDAAEVYPASEEVR